MAENRISDGAPAIRVEGLRKTYGNGEDAVTAVNDVSFEIDSGSVVGLLGPNGAGKTTIIKSVLGLILPDEGSIEIAGTNVHENPNEVYQKIGAILEGARNVYWRLTVRENLIYFAGLGGANPKKLRDRHDDLLERFNLVDRSDTVVNELSRGMKQKVSLASTLAHDVDVVFMDEPTLGLDVEASLELRNEINHLSSEEDVTIVLCSHDMDVIEDTCDSVLILNEGRIVEHDDVKSVMEKFPARKYEITLAPPISENVRERIETIADISHINSSEELVVILTEPDSERLYQLMNAFQDANLEVLNIESLDPDLEDVFLELTNSANGYQQRSEVVQLAQETDPKRAAATSDSNPAPSEVIKDGN